MVLVTGKRKRAIATALIKPGKGRIWINGVPIDIYPIEMARLKMLEPLLVAGKKLRGLVDIIIKVRGGGYMGQAEAVRMAIAKGLIEYMKSFTEEDTESQMQEQIKLLEKFFNEYDKHMLVGDPRRTEPKKPMRYSARRRWQKSYR
ncbi:MAG: 30S ribosomal protein S9 [Desulfurococcales archaeon]|nr:30S ribosomal protein S9 [Desulfurococcales archaeon]